MKISPARRIFGAARVPGDKSISHRAALIASLAEGDASIEGFASSKDCQSTLSCLKALGINSSRSGDSLRIEGKGVGGFAAPESILDAENSGSTIRMLSGILAGHAFTSAITGDESLRRRPMKRICAPLRLMGASVEATDEEYPPLRITGGRLKAIDYVMPVASAQVKSCVIFAGLFADGETSVTEPAPTRDHTEIMLREFGAHVETRSDGERRLIKIAGSPHLRARDGVYRVPGDISSAAFLIAAALMLQGSELSIGGVGLNPTRSAIIDLLIGLGASIEIADRRTLNGEPVGDLLIRSSRLESSSETRTIRGAMIANLIDEIPILSVLATRIEGGLIIRDASELRVKESDRIRTVVDNLRRMGAEVEEYPDGLAVAGRQELRGANIEAAGDHRIAMAFAVAGLAAKGETAIEGSETVEVSFPGFFETLKKVTEY